VVDIPLIGLDMADLATVCAFASRAARRLISGTRRTRRACIVVVGLGILSFAFALLFAYLTAIGILFEPRQFLFDPV
jgi:hypothetical protein